MTVTSSQVGSQRVWHADRSGGVVAGSILRRPPHWASFRHIVRGLQIGEGWPEHFEGFVAGVAAPEGQYWLDAQEVVFEDTRRREFPKVPGRLTAAYLFTTEADARRLGGNVWEIELRCPLPMPVDMSLWDDLRTDTLGDPGRMVTEMREAARRYFSGDHGPNPVWELLVQGDAVAVKMV